MATDTASPLESAIEKHLDSTTRLVRNVDLALSLFLGFTLILGGLFLAILADHWLLQEGLSMPLRFGVFLLLFAFAGLYIYRKVIPLFRYSINPVYTAHLIEEETPAFKNSLINWLLLRHERLERTDIPSDKIGERMYDGIVHTAAVNVQTVPTEHPVDFTKLVRVGALFMVLLTAFIAYVALSPKSPFASLARVLIPFGGIDRPQAAQFRNIKPGNATALQGEALSISAEVVSKSLEDVYLVFSTDDGQAAEQRIPMLKPEGKIAFETLFPPGKQGTDRGFNSSVDYWIAQGESRSKPFRIEVLPTASIEIVSLQYSFPAYTGLPPETIEHGGDVRTLEGTEVAVSVQSTLPLQNIDLVFDDRPAGKVSMKITGEQKNEAKGTFVLKYPFPYKSFAFQATDENGNVSRRSGIYQIEVIPDELPKVQWADTADHLKNARIDLPLNETLQLPVQAEDPDFALRYLHFKTVSTSNKQLRIPDEVLLTSPASGPTEHKGQITKTAFFLPEAKGFRVGDSVEVWGEAVDTKYPVEPKRIAATSRLTINIVASKEKEQKKDPEQKEGEEEQEGGSDQTGEQPSKEENPAEQKNDQTQKQDQGENSGDEDNSPEKESDQKESDQQDSEQKEGEPSPETKDQENEKQDDSKEGSQQADQKQGDNPTEEQHNQQEGNSGENRQEQAQQENNQNKGGASGDQQQAQQEGEEDSSQGTAGDEPSEGGGESQQGESGGGKETATEGEKSAEGSQQNSAEGEQSANEGEGSQSNSTSTGQGAKNSSTQPPKTPVNPETQDGDAMERIVDQMKKENKFNEPKPADGEGKSADGGQQSATEQPSGKQGEAANNKEGMSGKERGPFSQSAAEDAQRLDSPISGMNDQLASGKQDNSPGNQEKAGGEQGNAGQQSGKEGGEQGNAGQQSGKEGGEQGNAGQQSGNEGGEQGNAGQQSGKAGGEQGNAGQQSGNEGGGQGNESASPPQQPSSQGTSDPQNSNPNGQGAQQTGGTGGGGGGEVQTPVDDPNLEYADKVTNLVLEYLEDQLKEKPSEELLKNLGWSEEQLRQFYEKWQKMASESRTPQKKEGKNPWEEALKNLGITPNRQRPASQKNQTTIKDDGRVIESQRFEPPPGLKEQYKRYTEGIGK